MPRMKDLLSTGLLVYVLLTAGLFFYYRHKGRDTGSAKGGIKATGVWTQVVKDLRSLLGRNK